MAAWAVEVGVIGVRDLSGPARRFPLPSELLATFVVFGALSVVAGNPAGRRPANAVAWGLVVATLLASKVDVLKPIGDFLGGMGPSAVGGPPTAPATQPTPPAQPGQITNAPANLGQYPHATRGAI